MRVLYMCSTYQVLLVHGWTNRMMGCSTITVTFRSQGNVVVVAVSEGMRGADMGFVGDERVSCTYCLGRAARGTWLSPYASDASLGGQVGCADSSSVGECHSPPLALGCRVPSGDDCCRRQTPGRRAPPHLSLESAGRQRALEGQVGCLRIYR